MHICMDEVRLFFMALASVGGLGGAVVGLVHVWHWLTHKGKPADDGCCDGHEHD